MVMMRSSQRVMRNIMSNKNCGANSRAMNCVQSYNNKRNENNFSTPPSPFKCILLRLTILHQASVCVRIVVVIQFGLLGKLRGKYFTKIIFVEWC